MGNYEQLAIFNVRANEFICVKLQNTILLEMCNLVYKFRMQNVTGQEFVLELSGDNNAKTSLL